MIGLSLSFCVRDIVEGRVSLDKVERIIAGTRCETERDWDDCIKHYRQVYWIDKPNECVKILRELLATGKVDQPRLRGESASNIAEGHWEEDGRRIRF